MHRSIPPTICKCHTSFGWIVCICIYVYDYTYVNHDFIAKFLDVFWPTNGISDDFFPDNNNYTYEDSSEDVILFCDIGIYLDVTFVTWNWTGPVIDGDRVTIETNGYTSMLHFISPSPMDNGVYTCTARYADVYGIDRSLSKDYNLYINGK